MAGRVLLDSNIVIALFAGDNGVRQRLEQMDEVFLCSTVLGELYFGALKSQRIEENVRRIDEFADRNATLPCDAETARNYAMLKDRLKRRGRPIPENDIWVAAVAVQFDLVLVSRDDHFEAVERVRLERW